MGYNADDPENITYERFDEKKTACVSPEAVIKQLQDTIQQLVNEDILAIIINDYDNYIIHSIDLDEFNITIFS